MKIVDINSVHADSEGETAGLRVITDQVLPNGEHYVEFFSRPTQHILPQGANRQAATEIIALLKRAVEKAEHIICSD